MQQYEIKNVYVKHVFAFARSSDAYETTNS